MGQRLNIEIRKDDKVLANSYYHWSGYTSSSLKLVSLILGELESIKYENDTLRAIKLLEVTGAGLTASELGELDKNIKNNDFKQATSRNDGLIAVSDDGISETQSWEEARVEIHLDIETLKLKLYWEVDEKDYDEEDKPKYYEAALDYTEVSFRDFNTLKGEILKNINDKKYHFIFNDKKFGFIE